MLKELSLIEHHSIGGSLCVTVRACQTLWELEKLGK